MTKRYIPHPDAEFDEWLHNFHKQLVNIAPVIGLSSDYVNEVAQVLRDWEIVYKAHQVAKNAAQAATETKDEQRGMAEGVVRSVVRMLQANPKLTDAQRELLGITVRDIKPTPTAPEYVANLPPPLLLLDWSQRGQVIIHFGVNPQDERRNPKPENIAGAKLWYRVEGGEWMWLADDTNSPYVHKLEIAEPKTIEYRAQWFDTRMRLGPFSDIAKATITVE